MSQSVYHQALVIPTIGSVAKRFAPLLAAALVSSAIRSLQKPGIVSNGFNVGPCCARILLALFITCFSMGLAYSQTPVLLRDPTVSRTQIAFSFAGTLWIADRDGANLRRLTAGGHEHKPFFSPDGSQIAFSGSYDGMENIYVIPAASGEPRRLTHHPGDIAVAGWTPDGKKVLFTSRRLGFAPYEDETMQLFTVPVTGGFATPLHLDCAGGSYAPDQSLIAYLPNVAWQNYRAVWKRYRGGQTQPIWIARLSDSSIQGKIPRDNSNDFNPMWIGDTVYFLSDRNGPVTIFSYGITSEEVKQVVKNEGLDIKSAAATSDAIVYEQFGSLHLLDLRTGVDRVLDLHPTADFPETRPHFAKVDPASIRSAVLSPTGQQALASVRGEILVVPSGKGDVRNLTQTSNAAEIDPSWSPDGKQVAYFSDESGEYALHVRSAEGGGSIRKVSLGNQPGFYYALTWSPDCRKIAYVDQRLNLWYLDIDQRVPVRIGTFSTNWELPSFRPVWSPDSRWIAYTKRTPFMGVAHIYSLETRKTQPLTDGTTDVQSVAFDPQGRYLYFTASTDVGLAVGGASRFQQVSTRRIYVLVLGKNSQPPFPLPGNEKPADASKVGRVSPRVDIDFDAIARRIIPLPMPAGNYCAVISAKPGYLFVTEAASGHFCLAPAKVHRFDIKTQKSERVLEDITSFGLTVDGETALYAKQSRWFVAPSGDAGQIAVGEPLNLDNIKLYVDPRAEWRHMYGQVWRRQRDFFYDPGLHGLDLKATQERYAPFLENLSSRDDLNYLFNEMLGNIVAGHIGVWLGDIPAVERVSTGLLGADYAIENGRYRFTRIYDGDPWTPDSQGPLAKPGATVQAGEYLLTVDGRDVDPSADIYSFFLGSAGRQIKLTVSTTPDRGGSREVIVTPVESEASLRYYAWIEDNRRKVNELSGGRVAYIHVPNTMDTGYASFNRYYFAQLDKEAAILDARYNHGGEIATDIITSLSRPPMTNWHPRDGRDFTLPFNLVGPKVMLINAMSGSGGDALPWMFRRAGLGPLIGKRTWGGLIGGSSGELLDGGFVATAGTAFYNFDGAWEIENHGVLPDIEVEEDPAAVRAGRDPQLEKAVEVVLDMLKKNPPPVPRQHPPYPSHH